MMRARGIVLAGMLGAVGLLPACDTIAGVGASVGLARKPQAETRLPFAAKATQGAEGRDFTVAVRVPGGVGLADVRESVRHEATRHCLTTRGQSDADWVLDAATGDWAYVVQGDSLVFSGRCRA